MHTLPEFAHQWLDHRLAKLPPGQLKRASEQLSASYREQTPRRHLNQPGAVEAYLATRLPATLAAVGTVLEALQAAAPDWRPRHLLDLGAGPGTASLIASQLLPSLQSLKLYEAETAMLQMGKDLFAQGPALLRSAVWQQGRLPQLPPLDSADLVILSYVLNELPPADRTALLKQLAASSAVLVLIEPGTPVGYTHLLSARSQLLAAGRHLWAPCPHAKACPLEANDWCHFAARLPRSPLQRYLKQGSQNFEDEKFSYLICAPQPRPVASRILRHPLKHKGHLELRLCGPDGLRTQTLGKSHADYKAARKSAWGDPWPCP